MSLAYAAMIAGICLACVGWERWRARARSRLHLLGGLAMWITGSCLGVRAAGFGVGLATACLVAMLVACAFAFVAPFVRAHIGPRDHHRTNVIVSESVEPVGLPSRSSAGS